MFKKSIISILIISIFMLASYGGYRYRDHKAKSEAYDEILSILGSNIFLIDAMESEEYGAAKDLVFADVEGRLASLINLYENKQYEDNDYMRCVVTRKVRNLYLQHKILVTDGSLRGLGYPVERVKKYLEENCLGAASHDNWSNVDWPSDQERGDISH